MPRRSAEQITAASHGALVDGERIVEHGVCWATELKSRAPVWMQARRQFLMVMTDRRLLLFARRRRALQASDLVIGKRYEAFTLERVRRSLPLFQVRVQAANGTRMLFEFRPRQRQLGGALVARLTPKPALPAGGEPTAASDDATFWGSPTLSS
jgi:hypothetical protein